MNSGGINKKTILKQEEESRIEDHVNRIAHYEAYQMYRKYYKKILDAISEENCFPDSCSGGGVYLREAILKKVPEITERTAQDNLERTSICDREENTGLD